jgi:hypothetical protein
MPGCLHGAHLTNDISDAFSDADATARDSDIDATHKIKTRFSCIQTRIPADVDVDADSGMTPPSRLPEPAKPLSGVEM